MPKCLSWEGSLGGLQGPLWLPHVQIPATNSTSQVLALNIHLAVSAVGAAMAALQVSTTKILERKPEFA